MNFKPLQRNPQTLYITLGENRMIEKHKLEPAINQKLTTGQRKTEKKTPDLDVLAPTRAIRSCDTFQRIPSLDSCKWTIICMSVLSS